MDALLIKAKKPRPENAVFIDGGSNIGQRFSFFADRFSPRNFTCQLFEPNPECVARLREIVRQKWGENPNIEIIEKAISVRNGVAKFYGTAEDEGGALSEGGTIAPTGYQGEGQIHLHGSSA